MRSLIQLIDGENWTVQCEVLQHKPQGGGPPQEDPIPDLNLELGPPFDFFGLGRPVNEQGIQEDQNQDQGQQAQDPWLAQIQAQDHQDHQMQEAQDAGLLNLNVEPQPEDGAGLDLNQPPIDQDLDPVIINPLQPAQARNQQLLNDIEGHNEEAHYLLQHEGVVFQLNPQVPQEQEMMGVVDEVQPEPEQNIVISPFKALQLTSWMRKFLQIS